MARKPKPKPNYTFRDSFPALDNPRMFKPGDKKGYIIAYSGGLDSSTILNQAIEITEDTDLVQPFMMELIPGLDYCAYWHEYAWKRWKVRVRSYQHWNYSWYIRRGIFQLHADPTFPRIIPKDIERVVRADTGLYWVGYGYKSIDSLQRRGMMSKWEYGISHERGVFAPLKDWTWRYVLEYLTRKRIVRPIDPEYQSSGIDVSPGCMHWLRRYWPADYQRILKAFPLAVAQADRWEMLQEGKFAGRPVGTGDGKFPDAAGTYDWTPESQLDDLPLKMDNEPWENEKQKPWENEKQELNRE